MITGRLLQQTVISDWFVMVTSHEEGKKNKTHTPYFPVYHPGQDGNAVTRYKSNAKWRLNLSLITLTESQYFSERKLQQDTFP